MNVEVNIFYLKQAGLQTLELRGRVASICKDRSWNFQPRPVDIVRSRSGRPVALVRRDVAAGLYPRVHRARVATLVVGADPRVPLHPVEADVLRFNRHVPLRRFLDYKSFWVRIPEKPPNDSWLGSLEAWVARVDCEGEHDPRCLPFHVFTGQGAGLQIAENRHRFDDRYGTGADRTDEQGCRWLLDTHAYHGQESIHVAGFTLRPGFHWDVNGEGFRISTPEGVWEVGGYVNVYPDARLRATSRGHVRKLK